MENKIVTYKKIRIFWIFFLVLSSISSYIFNTTEFPNETYIDIMGYIINSSMIFSYFTILYLYYGHFPIQDTSRRELAKKNGVIIEGRVICSVYNGGYFMFMDVEVIIEGQKIIFKEKFTSTSDFMDRENSGHVIKKPKLTYNDRIRVQYLKDNIEIFCFLE